MQPYTTLDLIALALAAIHFGAPLTYYYYLKTRYLHKPWNLKLNPNYQPKVTIIIPTYNEAKFITKKLENILEQTYPKEKIKIIVIDSGSTDGTPSIIHEWTIKHPHIDLDLIQEPERTGMISALNKALRYVPDHTEVVIFTDADAFWDSNTISSVLRFFSDPTVGAVTTSVLPLKDSSKNSSEQVEGTYRNYYNVIRVGESKMHSTPIHNGTLIAYRFKLLKRLNGLPTYTGNNDSTPASLIAFSGYRAIQIENAIVFEPVRKNQITRKIRRAQHLLLHFIYTKRYAKKLGVFRKNKKFEIIWKMEYFIHVINPWFLVLLILLLFISSSIFSFIILIVGFLMLNNLMFRTWILNQILLIAAFLRNFKTRDLIWEK